MTENLLPCPFCGGEAEHRLKKYKTWKPRATGIIQCSSCLCNALSEESWQTRTQPPQDGWKDISSAPKSVVLVSRPDDEYYYTPTTAFLDVTDVWRVYRSEGGNEPIPFQPTHWHPLPGRPPQPAKTEGEE